MLGVVEAERIGDFADGVLCVHKLVLGQADQSFLDVFLWRLPRFFFQHIAKIIGREAKPVGEVIHSGQAVADGLFPDEVVVKQAFETGDGVCVGHGARGKLPFVKTHAIAKQHFDVHGQEVFAVLVHGMFEFALYDVQVVDENFPFTIGKMESLVDFIGEE